MSGFTMTRCGILPLLLFNKSDDTTINLKVIGIPGFKRDINFLMSNAELAASFLFDGTQILFPSLNIS